MGTAKLKFAGLLALLATAAPGSEAIERAVRFFLINPMVQESYLVVITPASPYAIAVRFNVVPYRGQAFLNKEITIVEGSFGEELLTLEESAALLEKFRAFDWSVKPEKKDLRPGETLVLAPRISFRARVDGTYREFEADATLVPGLANLAGVILTKKVALSRTPAAIPPAPARPP